jgi:type I protein arginine methyltransferase
LQVASGILLIFVQRDGKTENQPHTTLPITTNMSNDSEKKDDVSAKDNAYFGYYRQYVHQQNMLQDMIRTSAYRDAILANGPHLFEKKTVLDVGAGSGILSYFSVQAGAKLVVAVEASDMAGRIQKMVNAAGKNCNPWLAGKIKVVNGEF